MRLILPRLRLPKLAVLALLSLVGIAPGQETVPAQDQRQLNLDTFDQVWTTVRDRHFDAELGGVDWDLARTELRPQAAEAESTGKLRSILSELLAKLGQSHLAIIPGTGAAAVSADAGANRTVRAWDNGCGFEVRLEDGIPLVEKVTPRSAVDAAGVEKGWQITSVAGQKLPERCSFTGQVNFPLLAAQGASVSIGFVDSAGETRTVKVPLGERRGRNYAFPGMPATKVWIESKAIDDHVGYIAFSSFFDPESLMSQFNAAVEGFMDMDGIILDVRQNPGGMADMASSMMSWFVAGDERTVGTMGSRNADIHIKLPRRTKYFQGRVAVLIDAGSGSSSEIFAAGLRDLAGALVVGRNTAGAVLPSAFDPLPNGDSLQYIVANYYTIGGEELEGIGVAPDVKSNTRRTSEVLDDECILSALDWIYEEQ